MSEMNPHTPIDRTIPSETGQGQSGSLPVLTGFPRDKASGATAASVGGEEPEAGTPRGLHTRCVCAENLHELTNAITAVLINAQVMDWKLPPYSRLKRPVREIDRHAQRSGALLKRLLSQFETGEEASEDFCVQVSSLNRTMAVTALGPETMVQGMVNLPPLMPAPTAPDPGLASETELTTLCDPCTSISFPKGER